MQWIWRNIGHVYKLMRAPTTFIAFIIIASVSYYQFHDLTNAVILGLTVMFTASYGFALNEYFDYQKDLFIPEDHLIAKGVLSRKQVLIVSCSFLLLSLLLMLFIHPFQQLMNIILLIVLSFYSYINNRYGIIANALVAFCSGVGIVITLNKFEWSLISFSGLTFFLHIFGREIILDIHDYEADRNIGKTSFPILITISRSFIVAALFSISCIVYSVFAGMYFEKWGYMLMMTLANIIFLSGLFYYRARMNEEAYRQFVMYSRIAFLLSLPAVLL
ncbi:MAG: UbiA family prenyltransferase [Chitinophagaceae bacterium]